MFLSDGIKLTALQGGPYLSTSGSNKKKREIHTPKAIKMSARKQMELSLLR
jgi:hypothetical protein